MIDREYDWGDVIENDGPSYTLLPEGEYPFEVINFERKRFAGSAKLPPCNQAELTLLIDGGALGRTTVYHSLFLHTKTEGLLCAFFTAIGQRKRGEKLAMDWRKVIGAKGRCQLYVDKWTGRDGQERESNRVKSFVEPAPPAGAAQKGAYREPVQSGEPVEPLRSFSREIGGRGDLSAGTAGWQAGQF